MMCAQRFQATAETCRIRGWCRHRDVVMMSLIPAQFLLSKTSGGKIKITHLAGVDLLAAEGVVVGTHLDGGCADEVSVGVG